MYDEAVARNPYKLKFVLDHFITQEMCEKAVRMHSGREEFRTPCRLILPMPSISLFIPDHLKTQKMCEKAVEKNPWGLDYVPDHFKTQKMYNEVMRMRPYNLDDVPDHLKTQEMCKKSVELDLLSLIYVPDLFVTQQQIKPWDDDNDLYYELIKWYEGYEKRKAQKAKIEEELMPIVWHPPR